MTYLQHLISFYKVPPRLWNDPMTGNLMYGYRLGISANGNHLINGEMVYEVSTGNHISPILLSDIDNRVHKHMYAFTTTSDNNKLEWL